MSESDARDDPRRGVPGGDRPARTPGATGPTTRNVEGIRSTARDERRRAEESDVNDQLVGRARLARTFKRPLDPDKRTE